MTTFRACNRAGQGVGDMGKGWKAGVLLWAMVTGCATARQTDGVDTVELAQAYAGDDACLRQCHIEQLQCPYEVAICGVGFQRCAIGCDPGVLLGSNTASPRPSRSAFEEPSDVVF